MKKTTFRQTFLRHVAQTSSAPLMLEIERGEGIYLYDTDGKKFMDLISGIAVSCLGHLHPNVVGAVKAQAEKYMHTLVYGEAVMSPQVRLAQLLSDHLPDPLDSVYFTNSGSEAVEGTMKLARKYTGRFEIISARNAYHGSTQGAASLMSPPIYTRAFYPLVPGVRHIEFNDENDLKKITPKTACVIIEPIQGGDGVRLPKDDYLKKLRRRCDETGALLVLDEIQTGFGRTGTLWAFEQYDIVPDVLLLAKGMGGGMPIGAFVASREIMRVLSFDPPLGHVTTFGGHPVCCAAALATLETLLSENYMPEAKKKGDIFKKRLIHPIIKEVRGVGLMIGVELETHDMVKKVIRKCLDEGLILDGFLFNEKSFRIAPPLIITENEIHTACDIILNALTHCQNHQWVKNRNI